MAEHPGTSNDAAVDLDPDDFRTTCLAIERSVRSVMIGQEAAVRGTLICLVLGAHALLEGVPGLGKTSMARAFARAVGAGYSRIQFTPDLMPADITGTIVLLEGGSHGPQLEFQPGPVFAGLVLADEINRASPRTQSALLEAMQEGTVTVGRTTRDLPRPFSVLATQNPVEMQGTYPLPEAQLDRFLLKVEFDYPSANQLTEIVTTTLADPVDVAAAADPAQLLRMGALARTVPAAAHVRDYASRLVIALQPGDGSAPIVRDNVRLGPSPRGAQALTLAGNVTALLDGRHNLSLEDVRTVARPALRHRLVLNFDAERTGVTADRIIDEVVAMLPEDHR
jgi:MoxR-like ATPase